VSPVKGHLRQQGKDKRGQPAGNWYAVIDEYDAWGKPRRRWVNLHTTNKHAAEDALHRLLAEAEAGGLPSNSRTGVP
jgi:hypothetical protein